MQRELDMQRASVPARHEADAALEARVADLEERLAKADRDLRGRDAVSVPSYPLPPANAELRCCYAFSR